jgi:hypothetical protein
MYEISQIPNAENYFASRCGNILSTKYGYFRKLKKKVQRNGYEVVTLQIGNKKHTRLVHRLIMVSFLGESGKEVNHIDGAKANNRIENLEYSTKSENLKHAYKTGLAKKTMESVRSFSKLDDIKVGEIKKMLKDKTNSELGSLYGVKRQTINSIRIGASWRHVNG